nr:MAG TPA: hypothetical protein [Caudoviricetes sp.]
MSGFRSGGDTTPGSKKRIFCEKQKTARTLDNLFIRRQLM